MEAVRRAASWAGWPLDDRGEGALARLGDWLETEAIPAGGLGPNEAMRVESRHLADSLLFARGWRGPVPPASLVDLGAGVGLPGLPLAILWPETEVTLVDRAGRRIDLARRACRILDLGNVRLVQEDAGTHAGVYEMVVGRAAGPVDSVREWALRLVAPGGVVVVGGSHRRPPEPGPGEVVVEVEAGVLDRTVWLRMITPS